MKSLTSARGVQEELQINQRVGIALIQGSRNQPVEEQQELK